MALPSVSRCTSYLLLVLSTTVFIKNFWLNEDAFIIFRSLEQLLNGNGAVWNPGERVQIYTSVAWYWLLAALNTAVHDVFVSTIILTTALFLLLLILARRLWGDAPSLWFVLTLFLLSKGFFDYTSSGLENILAYCALLGLYGAYHDTAIPVTEQTSKRGPYLIAAITACLPLIRHDLAILGALPFVWLLWRQRYDRHQVLALLVIVSLPLICWTAVSLVYYGLPFPNTAYAKLNHGVETKAILQSGFNYFYSNALYDPMTLSIIAISAVVSLCNLQPWQKAFAIGTMLYCLYLFKSGGDYMLGRFLSFPFLVSTALLADWFRNYRMRPVILAPAFAVIIVYVASVPSTPVITPWCYGRNSDYKKVLLSAIPRGSLDQRLLYHDTTLAAWWFNEQRVPSLMEAFREDADRFRASNDKTVVHNAIGFTGYYAGPEIHIVDSYALSDPLLAQLPGIRRIFLGHFEREVVPGYLDRLRDGVTPLHDAELNQYYAAIDLITRSPDLFSMRRLQTIVAFNLGYYDHLLDTYRQAFKRRHTPSS